MVALTVARWTHILERHGELAQHRQRVLAAVAMPEAWLAGRFPGEEWFYVAWPGRDVWIKVVVHYDGHVGDVRTAFPRRWIP